MGACTSAMPAFPQAVLLAAHPTPPHSLPAYDGLPCCAAAGLTLAITPIPPVPHPPLLHCSGRMVAKGCQSLPYGTNNTEAEYWGLVYGLEAAAVANVRRLAVQVGAS